MISIIVPIYNVEKFLPQCLDSLIGQTYRDIEIICVNDGSTDGSLAILNQYAAKDARIRVVSQENQGLSGARNTGINDVRGEWMMFVDGDDWLELNCCELVMTSSENADLVFFSYIRKFRTGSAPKYIFDEHPKRYSGEQMDWLFERLIAPNGEEMSNPAKLDSLSTAWGKLYKTAVIKQHHLQFVSTEEIGTEDLLFNVEYFTHSQNAHYLPTPLYHYRKLSGASLAYSHKSDLDKKWQKMFQRIEEKLIPLDNKAFIGALERRKALCLFGLGLNIVFSRKGLRAEHKMLDEIICSDWYRTAIAKLDMSPMPMHWKCFYASARHQQTWAVLLMVKMINLIINR